MATLARWIASAAFGFACTAVAQTSPNPLVQITPEIAAPGVQRTISVRVTAIVGCAPTGARLDTSRVNAARIVMLVLDGARFPPLCLNDIVSFASFQLTYTPEAEGPLRLLVAHANGPWVGEFALETRANPTLRSQFDLTGMWYDPATNGSGLTFVHAHARGDGVFGTWYLYDSAGRPRWYSIQNVVWRPGGNEAQGVLFSSAAPINICPLTIIGCPVAASITLPIAQVRIVMNGASRARVEALSANGGVIFGSNIVRAGI